MNPVHPTNVKKQQVMSIAYIGSWGHQLGSTICLQEGLVEGLVDCYWQILPCQCMGGRQHPSTLVTYEVRLYMTPMLPQFLETQIRMQMKCEIFFFFLVEEIHLQYTLPLIHPGP